MVRTRLISEDGGADRSEGSLLESITRFAARTPMRTFVLYPISVTVWSLIASRGHPRWRWQFSPLLAWGYLQYRWCGSYRRSLGGGGPGLDRPPDQLVTTGPYAIVRNPMYLGHIIFLFGLALLTKSWLAWVLAAGTAWWFNGRVAGDEKRLRERFGEEYLAYQRNVGRWLPRPPVRI